MDIVPGYDPVHGNKNSVLYKTYGDQCIEYNPSEKIEGWTTNTGNKVAVVHSMGFGAFLAARQEGGFVDTERLLVLDGAYPKTWGETPLVAKIPPFPCIFFFSTVGDRSGYPLEAVVRQAMLSRKDITVVRGIDFGHNLLYGSFGCEKVKDLVQYLLSLPTDGSSERDILVTRT